MQWWRFGGMNTVTRVGMFPLLLVLLGMMGANSQEEAKQKPILNLGASDGVYYKVLVFPDMTIKGYTRHCNIMVKKNDVSFSGKVTPEVLNVLLNAIENTGFARISMDQVNREIQEAKPGVFTFRSDQAHTYVFSTVKGHEMEVQIYDVEGKLKDHPAVRSLQTADKARQVIVDGVKLLMSLKTVQVDEPGSVTPAARP
jgi:hypothetical protein